jgi:hypothetical protein
LRAKQDVIKTNMEIARVKKICPILMGFLMVILTVGCSQVVYRVKPDSPPKMGIQEAREALDLSLSLAQILQLNPHREGESWNSTC